MAEEADGVMVEVLFEYKDSRKELSVIPTEVCETIAQELKGLGIEGSVVVSFSGGSGDFLLQKYSSK